MTHPAVLRAALVAVAALAGAVVARASEIVEVLPLTDSILMVHFDDGRVIHHVAGQPRSAERVEVDPLDVAAASAPSAWRVASAEDPAYAGGKEPVKVGRKSKGTQFAWFADRWVNGRVVNDRPDHAKEHWVYLRLPAPLQRGRTYELDTGSLATNGKRWTVRYDEAFARSEAVHVNTIGYVPTAPEKYAYVYHWMGDLGVLELGEQPRTFAVVDAATGERVFAGEVKFRAARDRQETFHKDDSPPHGSFLKADVWECDFSAFTRPGRYVVAVDGVGASWPFTVGEDVYRLPFFHVARALYHNRSGIELKEPYTEFTRPAPHHPKLTPGFEGKLRYTTVRFTEWGSEGGNPKELEAAMKGALEDAWGWYQDAGDWDSYVTHLRVARELLLVYELAPGNFSDGELNIPESGNGVPDVLDEAAWLPRFCFRLRQELLRKRWGTGGVGLRVAGDAFGSDEGTAPDGSKVGRGSWQDTDRIYAVSGEDPWSTYGYAGSAAHLAWALRKAGVARDPLGVDWLKEATEAYAWAAKNTQAGDEKKGPNLRELRAYAAAALFRMTGDRAYERQLIADTQGVGPRTELWETALFGPALYVLDEGPAKRDVATVERLRAAILHTADVAGIETREKRALRWGGNFSFPMLIGQQTTPWLLETAVARVLTEKTDPAKSRRYQAALYTTADYFLGANALNMTWYTGVGPRYPTDIFHMDAWYNGKGRYQPGLSPYSPWRKEDRVASGPWDHMWPYPTAYPDIDQWPGNERWFSNRCSPMASEFTIHQNTGPAAAFFGLLCGPAKR